jgi:hypothetical protein
MSGLAIFGLKYPSLLQFDKGRNEELTQQNLKDLYGVENTPSDTTLRKHLDRIDPTEVRGAFKKVFSRLQRGKVLQNYKFMGNRYLLSVDGTGFFSSKQVHCKQCCEKHHRNGDTTYYHQALGAAIIHPDRERVIPICPEPILKGDGAKKNDCERNASIRLLRDFRREHPRLKVVVVEDALASNGPHIKLLKELNMDFILVAKPDGNKALFEWVNDLDEQDLKFHSFIDEMGHLHEFRYANGIPLNDSHPDLKVNFLKYTVYNAKKKQIYNNTWVTNLRINKKNAFQIARGGRARWKVENETFNCLKNHGYHFEHNYGHGEEHLSSIFLMLMMLAFFIDEAQHMCCKLFNSALKKLGSKKLLWLRLRSLFDTFEVGSWEAIWHAITNGSYGGKLPSPNTS